LIWIKARQKYEKLKHDMKIGLKRGSAYKEAWKKQKKIETKESGRFLP
jgi:hypothetical protein